MSSLTDPTPASEGVAVRPSVRELARRLDVSIATVSRALNGHPEVAPQTRDRVLELASSLNYDPQNARRERRSPEARSIALVYPSSPVIYGFGTFEAALLGGVMQGLREQRYSVTIIDLEHERLPGESYRAFFERRGVRGAIVRTPTNRRDFAGEIAAEGLPAILVADRTDDPNLGYIYTDSRADSARAVDHLVLHGHRRIGLIRHFVMDADHTDRLEGYLEGLARNGIDADESLIVESRGGTAEGGAAALDDLLALPEPPTAVYVTNPVPTTGVLHRCLQLGIRVPEEFSVVGFDDSDIRMGAFPPFTAVCQDARQMGVEAARWLSRLAEGHHRGLPRERRSTHLSIHQSTGPAPRRALRLAPDRTTIVRDS